MDPLLLILMLTLAAAVLLVGDLFLPSGGIMSVVGVGLLVTVVIICFTINRWLGLATLFGLTVASPFVAAGLIRAWKHTPVGRRMILAETAVTPRPRGPVVRVGAVGRTLSTLRPMGEAEFSTDAGTITLQAKSEFGDLPPGSPVRVVHFKDGIVTVRGVDATSAAASVVNGT